MTVPHRSGLESLGHKVTAGKTILSKGKVSTTDFIGFSFQPASLKLIFGSCSGWSLGFVCSSIPVHFIIKIYFYICLMTWIPRFLKPLILWRLSEVISIFNDMNAMQNRHWTTQAQCNRLALRVPTEGGGKYPPVLADYSLREKAEGLWFLFFRFETIETHDLFLIFDKYILF